MYGKNIIMIGPPCSGKGTHSKLIASNYNFEHISTGELFRVEISNGTAIGIMAKMLIDKGSLIPDDITMKILYRKLSSLNNQKNLLFDGVPRTLSQAELIDKYIEKHNLKIDLVFYLNAPDDILLQRMSKRSSVENRTDDTDTSFLKRMMVYYDQTHVLTEYYLAKGKLVTISTDGSISEISAKIFDSINKYVFDID